jgi:hypothetical protein
MLQRSNSSPKIRTKVPFLARAYGQSINLLSMFEDHHVVLRVPVVVLPFVHGQRANHFAKSDCKT